MRADEGIFEVRDKSHCYGQEVEQAAAKHLMALREPKPPRAARHVTTATELAKMFSFSVGRFSGPLVSRGTRFVPFDQKR
eukprot:6463712-Amphidinium_carterae.3